ASLASWRCTASGASSISAAMWTPRRVIALLLSDPDTMGQNPNAGACVALASPLPHDAPDMETERPSPRYAAIDAWETADVRDAMVEGQLAAVAAVRAQRPAIERAAVAMERRLRAGGRL